MTNSIKPTTHDMDLETSVDLTLFNLDLARKEDVIKTLSDLFLSKDIVHETYLKAVLGREKSMPTGLITKSGGIAIPHTDSEHVKRSAIAIGRLRNPVKFNNMANPLQEIDVNIVFLLAIADKDQVNPILSKMAELLQNKAAFTHMLEIDNAQELADYFTEMVSAEK